MGAPRPALPAAPRGGMSKVAEPHLLMSAPRPAEAVRPPRGSRKVAEPHFLESALPAAVDSVARPGREGAEWADTINRMLRGLERGSRLWTAARRKDSLQRVLDGSRGDDQRLRQRLSQLVASWDDSGADGGIEISPPPAEAAEPSTRLVDGMRVFEASLQAPSLATSPAPSPAHEAGAADQHPQVTAVLSQALRKGLPVEEPRAAELAAELASLADRIHAEGATPELAASVAGVCARAERLFAHRHHLVDQLLQLCRSLTEGLTEFAEDGSWVQGQSQTLRASLDEGVSARAVRAACDLLELTRRQHRELHGERDRARDSLKAVVQQMLTDLASLDDATGRFGERIARHADVIAQADTLDGVADAVREMLTDTRTVHQMVSDARQRLGHDQARAQALESRVRGLEGELRRLSDEVATDVLTQVANRRGLFTAFELERARLQDGTPGLAVGLIDIDNFKRLNDTLGHAVGDVALKALAGRVKSALRPGDHLARFGGEEFVVLLPDTPLDLAQQALTRLQRDLSAALFMHEGRDVFVTFSAGVTAYRPDETLDAALERADEGLYEAKRTGKNRTCVA